MTPLTIELPSPCIASLRAAQYLVREARGIRVRFAPEPTAPPEQGVLRIETASVVCPVLTVAWAGEHASEISDRDVNMALSREVWAHDAGSEMWQLTAAPLPAFARVGAPDFDRPWVLLATESASNADRIEGTTGLPDAQVHFIGAASASAFRKPVCWLPTRRVVRSLLGQVDAVVAPWGPLAWDAVRAGVPCFVPDSPTGVPHELAASRLAKTVSAPLAKQGPFWRSLAQDILRGRDTAPWGTVTWLQRARARATAAHDDAQPFNLETMTRKFRKLQRDPRAFLADSKITVFRSLRTVVDSGRFGPRRLP